jgi:hypothetical protein
MRKIIVLLMVLLFVGITFAYVPEDVSWKGYVNIHFDKESFDIGEEVTGKIVVSNLATVPIVGEKIVLHVSDASYNYPSQYSSANVIREQVISDTWILPNSMKAISFNLGVIPEGEYFLETYSWILKTKFVGASSIFLNPTKKEFKVGDLVPTKRIEISRLKTWFGSSKQIGPVGFPVKAGETITGKVFVDNSLEARTGLKLEISLCDWASAFCDTPEITIISIPQLPTGENSFDVELIAPQIPSAYAINMKLFEGDELLSVYKNRVIVKGGTAKIRKVEVRGLETGNYSVFALVVGSPDHFTSPDFDDFKLELKAYENDATIIKKEQNYASIASGEILDAEFDLGSQKITGACLRVIKDSTTYDESCFTVPLEEVQVAYNVRFPEVVKVNWSYNENTELLDLELYKEISNTINARIRVLGAGETIFDETVKTTGKVNREYALQRKNYSLVIDDKDAKRQIVILLELEESNSHVGSDLTNDSTTCPGVICSGANVCSSTPFETGEGACCMSECVSSTTLGITKVLPLIFLGAILVVIAAIIILLNALGKIGGKKR